MRYTVFVDLEPPATAVTYVDSHDTQRDGSTLSYRDGAGYLLAVAFLLTHPYGIPTRGYVVLNRAAQPFRRTVETGLPGGTTATSSTVRGAAAPVPVPRCGWTEAGGLR